MFSNDLHNAKKDVNIMIEIYKTYFINDYNFYIADFKRKPRRKYILHWNYIIFQFLKIQLKDYLQ